MQFFWATHSFGAYTYDVHTEEEDGGSKVPQFADFSYINFGEKVKKSKTVVDVICVSLLGKLASRVEPYAVFLFVAALVEVEVGGHEGQCDG